MEKDKAEESKKEAAGKTRTEKDNVKEEDKAAAAAKVADDKEKQDKDADKDKDKQKKQKEEADKAKSKMPSKPCALAITKSPKQVKLRAMMLSLDGLLDYDESDRYEATFEVIIRHLSLFFALTATQILQASLFGELFHEMLQQEFGRQILQALLAVPKARRSPTPEPEPSDKSSRKRQRESGSPDDAKSKKQKPAEVKVGESYNSTARFSNCVLSR